MRWAVILAGGSGSRFWPLSTPSAPKQLLKLLGEQSTAEQTSSRLDGLVPPERRLVVTGPALAEPLRQAFGIPASNILIEPRAASTAPALVWATAVALRQDPDAEVLSLHADWVVREESAFRHTADQALQAAVHHRRLVTVGIVPSRPETGYGYIVPGQPLDGAARSVTRFTEKPDAATALDLMASGALWNSGLFAWTGAVLMNQIRACTPEIARHLPALEQGDIEAFFAGVTPVSIDVGLLERSSEVAVIPGRFTWDDVGTWDALARVRPQDTHGNVTHGTVHVADSRDCVVWSSGDPIILYGVSDLVVIHANGRVLVMPRSKAAHLKTLLDQLPAPIRDLE